MPGPIFTVTIDCTSLELDPIVINGHKGPGWWIRPGWQMPGLQPQTRVADSDRIHGEPATSSKWVNGIMSGDITFQAADAADRALAVARMRAAIGRLSYPVVSNWNGDEQTWRAMPASFTPSPLDYREVSADQVTYAIAITVRPISTPGGL